jgi:hypothetical protein
VWSEIILFSISIGSAGKPLARELKVYHYEEITDSAVYSDLERRLFAIFLPTGVPMSSFISSRSNLTRRNLEHYALASRWPLTNKVRHVRPDPEIGI